VLRTKFKPAPPVRTLEEAFGPATFVSEGGLEPHRVAAQPGPRAPDGLFTMEEKMNPKKPDDGLGIWDYVSGFLGDGLMPHEVRRAEGNRRRLEGLRTEVLGGDPREFLAYLTNPEKWAEKVSSNYEGRVVEGGNTLMRPGYGQTTAPKVGVDGGTGYTQMPGATEWGPSRPLNDRDFLDAQIKAAELALQRAQAAHREWFDRERIGIDRFEAQSGRISANKPSGNGNGASPRPRDLGPAR
jgi:hypothetical protein